MTITPLSDCTFSAILVEQRVKSLFTSNEGTVVNTTPRLAGDDDNRIHIQWDHGTTTSFYHYEHDKVILI